MRYSKSNTMIIASMISLAASCGATLAADTEIKTTLENFAADYAHDVTLTEAKTFGVQVGDDWFTVSVDPSGDGTSAVTNGAPKTPTYYFTFQDTDAFETVAKGEKNALTMMAKAFSSDVTPMDMDVQEGFVPGETFLGDLLSTAFHFWTMGKPEIVKFSPEATRFTHGANAGVFYYQPGFRSAWFSIEPGHHVNEDENSRSNPFPSLMILVDGSITARIDGEDSVFNAGEAMLIPAGVTHEFLNNGAEAAFGFLFMFGDGA